MSCGREAVLIRSDAVCFENIATAAESMFQNHLGAVFFVTIILIGIFSYIANRGPNGRPIKNDDVNYQLQNINNRLDRLGK